MTTMSLTERVTLCIENRKLVADTFAAVLRANPTCSESELQAALQAALAAQGRFYPEGWYDPPPGGVAVLFADKTRVERTKFPTLRTEPNWPKPEYRRHHETVGMVYASPVHRETGLIADMGMTFYQGDDPKIQQHLKLCLETAETMAAYAQVGMSFAQLHDKAQLLLQKQGLDNSWMVTFNDPLHGPDFGHHMPWTNELPTAAEQVIIDSGDRVQLKDLITRKRLYINAAESFRIPETIAFSVEPRFSSQSDTSLPAAYYYCLVTFREGERTITSGCNPIFSALGMNYLRSRFE